jgi:hypothetical protein
MNSGVDIGILPISEWRFSVRHICLRYRNNRCRCRMLDIATMRSMTVPTYAGSILLARNTCEDFQRTLFAFKGTVAQDFLASVFFMDLLYMGPRFWGEKDFLFFIFFAKLFKYFYESTLWATAGIQNWRCDLLRLLSFPAVAYSAYLQYNYDYVW